MALTFQFLSPSSLSPHSATFISRNPSSFLRFSPCRFPNSPHFRILDRRVQNPFNFGSINAHQFSPRVGRRDGGGDGDLDSILSAAELFCLVSSLIASVGFALNCCVKSSSKSVFLAVFGDRVLVGAILFLVAGVGIGAWIRRRRWNRVFRETAKGALEVDLVERTNKLEEDLRSSAMLIRVLSRQLEKLGIRFRVTRKALKKPIEEPLSVDQFLKTAALAQKTCGETRALAVRGDILEKELAEIQKVLLAMQEQQQKQLELILAIGKSGKIW